MTNIYVLDENYNIIPIEHRYQLIGYNLPPLPNYEDSYSYLNMYFSGRNANKMFRITLLNKQDNSRKQSRYIDSYNEALEIFEHLKNNPLDINNEF